MEERIQKILSSRGMASRRAAEEWIRQGRVRVNGSTACLGDSADPVKDVIEVDGVPLPRAPEYVYILLNKPRGFVTTAVDPQGRRTVLELVADCGTRVYPVGRLDLFSEGLLLLTNDGALANHMTHPSGCVRKVYHVWVSGYRDGAVRRLSEPIQLDGRRIRRPLVRLLSENECVAMLEITIFEGRNRQIRRMCEHAGLKVTRLKRVQEGDLMLGTLPVGKWRYLTQAECAALKAD